MPNTIATKKRREKRGGRKEKKKGGKGGEMFIHYSRLWNKYFVTIKQKLYNLSIYAFTKKKNISVRAKRYFWKKNMSNNFVRDNCIEYIYI